MAIHLVRDLEKLKKELLFVGSMVEDATNKAIVALIDRRLELAEEVIVGDRDVDEREVQVEEECLKVLALHQPVAADLRFVVTVLKVNNDLERVGDLAGNIAARARYFAEFPGVEIQPEIKVMAESTRGMLKDSLSALISLDTKQAGEVLRKDEDVDRLHKGLFTRLREMMIEDPATIPHRIELLSVSRYLERIADLATNIAEDVIFMVDGDVVRHQSW